MFYKFRALDTRLDRAVELDICDPTFQLDEYQKRSISGQLHADAMMDQASIQKILDVSYHEEPLYVVKELLSGVTLTEYMEKATPIPWKHVLYIAEKIASALNHIHSRGLYYGGFNADDIFVIHDGQIKCADNLISLKRELLPGIIRESHYYMNPSDYWTKQLYNGEAVDADFNDAQNDIYSLGVILYELMCGYSEHKNDSQEERESVVQAALTEISNSRGVNSYKAGRRDADDNDRNAFNPIRELWEIIGQCISTNVESRYLDAGVLYQVISFVIEDLKMQ